MQRTILFEAFSIPAAKPSSCGIHLLHINHDKFFCFQEIATQAEMTGPRVKAGNASAHGLPQSRTQARASVAPIFEGAYPIMFPGYSIGIAIV